MQAGTTIIARHFRPASTTGTQPRAINTTANERGLAEDTSTSTLVVVDRRALVRVSAVQWRAVERSMSRPSRSDAHLSPVDEAMRVAEVREYYDDAAPKRHTKPSRSEHSAVYTDDALVDSSHPELDKLQELEAHTEKLVCEGGKAGEEFVETEYYKDLGCVGEQHHTTGTGFITMDKPTGASFELSEDPDATERHASSKGNPATNEWIPSADTVYQASDKPNRSDS